MEAPDSGSDGGLGAKVSAGALRQGDPAPRPGEGHWRRFFSGLTQPPTHLSLHMYVPEYEESQGQVIGHVATLGTGAITVSEVP